MGSIGTRRPIRIANCSGANPDPGYKMLEQTTAGQVDAITGDYLAEFNLATNALDYQAGKHKGWEPTCEDGILQTLEAANSKQIKIVVDGGALNPKGLAERVQSEVTAKGYDLKLSYVEGDDVTSRLEEIFRGAQFEHLDAKNEGVKIDKLTRDWLSRDNKERPEIISAHAYLGARGIVAALRAGADIVICGRVADASPVIGLAAWWHAWSEHDFDQLAGALIAGHLIECSGYGTGGNFCGFTKFPIESSVNLGYPIAEIEQDGTCVVTKHEALKGRVTRDTVRGQLLYELQGNIYLNSDVKADIKNIQMREVGDNRVNVFGVKGYPPPATTKLAMFYQGGYQLEWYLAATGTLGEVYAKWDLVEAQIAHAMKRRGISKDQLDILEYQRIGVPETNPRDQYAGTAILRVFVQGESRDIVTQVYASWCEMVMQHYSGMHATLDTRTAVPRPFLGFVPAIIPQSALKEKAVLLKPYTVLDAGTVSVTEALAPLIDEETTNPVPLESFGPTIEARMGDVVYARSGDKGSNNNVGFWVHEQDEYDWLRSALTKKELIRLLGGEWKEEFALERVEMPGILAVHFVVYGLLGRGVSSTARLDNFGKGLADFLRAR
ncbi:uncharacterized protein A1O5_08529 [Cladophialophora psammophila CBS 110553]|uniref:DUF1446 domain-containing protein n=1 Tax=Cladophialophora psammophila CBS 110553 TaxID=1182543 RepID=W9WUK7_9EURO|nr:uncharacterized protein A1O5_08529 [Cladophialophora psammophila CBS 110553]EXJ68735.1 hypothetical protein A1O5_08529 [Cladophialophora psammophila CBS 110553]